MTAPKLSRRDFLKGVGVGTATLAALRIAPLHASEVDADGYGVLIDLTRCVGCNSCALACKEANQLPNADEVPTGLDKNVLTFVDQREAQTEDGKTVTRYVKRQCMHCLDAACVSACPAAAMYKSEEGPVVYRPSRCLGCRYCQLACPFEMPRFDWENGLTPEISKCWMCYSRLQAGEIPACVDACPTGALRFGTRKILLKQAHAQIRSNPGRYVNHVYGEHEVGGTSMLYLSDVSFERLGFPGNLPTTAPPEQTEKVMSTLPYVIGGMASLMVGAAAVTHRQELKSLAKDGLLAREPIAPSETAGPFDGAEEPQEAEAADQQEAAWRPPSPSTGQEETDR